MHPFDAAVELTPTPDQRLRGATHPAYANMVGPFGGTTAAVLLQAALRHPDRLGDPVALTVNFAAPIADGAFVIDAQPARTNRSTQHWTLALAQDDGVAATATAVFAKRRSTWSAPEAEAPAGLPAPHELPEASLAGRPAWVHRYDMRFVEGPLPDAFDDSEQPHSRSVVWVRDEPPRPLDFASLAALCDSFFPRVWMRRRTRTPIGTVSITTYFHADEQMLAAQADRPVLGVVRAQAFRDGYFDHSAQVWDDAGRLLASTHQLVYYRE